MGDAFADPDGFGSPEYVEGLAGREAVLDDEFKAPEIEAPEIEMEQILAEHPQYRSSAEVQNFFDDPSSFYNRYENILERREALL